MGIVSTLQEEERLEVDGRVGCIQRECSSCHWTVHLNIAQ